MPTDMPINETPDINSDRKNLLLVFPTEVFPVEKEKNGTYVSVYLHNRETKFIGV